MLKVELATVDDPTGKESAVKKESGDGREKTADEVEEPNDDAQSTR